MKFESIEIEILGHEHTLVNVEVETEFIDDVRGGRRVYGYEIAKVKWEKLMLQIHDSIFLAYTPEQANKLEIFERDQFYENKRLGKTLTDDIEEAVYTYLVEHDMLTVEYVESVA